MAIYKEEVLFGCELAGLSGRRRCPVQQGVARLADFVRSGIRTAHNSLGTTVVAEYFAAVLAPVLATCHAEHCVARRTLFEVVLVLKSHLDIGHCFILERTCFRLKAR